MSDTWDLVFAERAALADDLDGLPGPRWNTESWCDGWTVRRLLAHLTATASTGPAAFVVGLVRNGLSFERFVEAGLERHLGSSPQDTLARFRAVERSTTCPPGPRTSWLGEVVVHGQDIRRPLGMYHEPPAEAVRRVADFYCASNALIGGKRRVAGLRLQATDQDWSHGEGELVTGPLLSLVMATTGRGAACHELEGPGVATLLQRC